MRNIFTAILIIIHLGLFGQPGVDMNTSLFTQYRGVSGIEFGLSISEYLSMGDKDKFHYGIELHVLGSLYTKDVNPDADLMVRLKPTVRYKINSTNHIYIQPFILNGNFHEGYNTPTILGYQFTNNKLRFRPEIWFYKKIPVVYFTVSARLHEFINKRR